MARRFPLLKIPLRLLSNAARCFSALRGPQIDARPASLGKSNGDRLLRRSRAMFPFPNVVHFLPHKFASLCAGRLSFFFILMRSFNDFVFRHFTLLKFCLENCLIDVHRQIVPVPRCSSRFRRNARLHFPARKLNAQFRVI
jgi:hypothetical protein